MHDAKDALAYHRDGRPGKIEVVPTKPFVTQADLSLAYTPGVAEPCRAIHADPERVFDYTAKGNLVAVITNGTAVLGLGDIGPAAGKPVMEGKANLFKRFADVDVFDLELDTHDPDEIIAICRALAPTFGGINLEDIRAPECFRIERELQELVDIPVFHDDQHGTAIISAAALLNAVELVDKRLEDLRVVILGAGAAGIATAELFVELGIPRENLLLCDSRGVIYTGREQGMNAYKARFAVDTSRRSLADAMEDADVFCGYSVGGTVSGDLLRKMAPNPIVFALANPDPEIPYDEARAARPDAILATGRSDFPNQVNNVLGFPFIFRGALDCRARGVNGAMKIAASRALARLAREDVPDEVTAAYGGQEIQFGPDYVIPKPFDHRVLLWIAPAVARAAMETGMARKELDLDAYVAELESRLGKTRALARGIALRARELHKRVAYPEGEHPRVIRAARMVLDDRIAEPVLIGNPDRIRARMAEHGIDPDGIAIEDPRDPDRNETLAAELFAIRQRRGVTMTLAREQVREPATRAALLVQRGDADALICGVEHHYPDTLRPALQIIGVRDDVTVVAGLYLVVIKNEVFFLADTTVNVDPSSEVLAEIAILAAHEARKFHIEPRVALLSFSNFGSTRHPRSDRVREATRLVREREPDLVIDGEMMADTAVTASLLRGHYPFSRLQERANVLVFPSLEAGNIAYKLLHRLGAAEVIGPIFVGMKKPVYAVETGAGASDIVTMTAIAVVE